MINTYDTGSLKGIQLLRTGPLPLPNYMYVKEWEIAIKKMEQSTDVLKTT